MAKRRNRTGPAVAAEDVTKAIHDLVGTPGSESRPTLRQRGHIEQEGDHFIWRHSSVPIVEQEPADVVSALTHNHGYQFGAIGAGGITLARDSIRPHDIMHVTQDTLDRISSTIADLVPAGSSPIGVYFEPGLPDMAAVTAALRKYTQTADGSPILALLPLLTDGNPDMPAGEGHFKTLRELKRTIMESPTFMQVHCPGHPEIEKRLNEALAPDRLVAAGLGMYYDQYDNLATANQIMGSPVTTLAIGAAAVAAEAIMPGAVEELMSVVPQAVNQHLVQIGVDSAIIGTENAALSVTGTYGRGRAQTSSLAQTTIAQAVTRNGGNFFTATGTSLGLSIAGTWLQHTGPIGYVLGTAGLATAGVVGTGSYALENVEANIRAYRSLLIDHRIPWSRKLDTLHAQKAGLTGEDATKANNAFNKALDQYAHYLAISEVTAYRANRTLAASMFAAPVVAAVPFLSLATRDIGMPLAIRFTNFMSRQCGKAAAAFGHGYRDRTAARIRGEAAQRAEHGEGLDFVGLARSGVAVPIEHMAAGAGHIAKPLLAVTHAVGTPFRFAGGWIKSHRKDEHAKICNKHFHIFHVPKEQRAAISDYLESEIFARIEHAAEIAKQLGDERFSDDFIGTYLRSTKHIKSQNELTNINDLLMLSTQWFVEQYGNLLPEHFKRAELYAHTIELAVRHVVEALKTDRLDTAVSELTATMAHMRALCHKPGDPPELYAATLYALATLERNEGEVRTPTSKTELHKAIETALLSSEGANAARLREMYEISNTPSMTRVTNQSTGVMLDTAPIEERLCGISESNEPVQASAAAITHILSQPKNTASTSPIPSRTPASVTPGLAI